MVLELKLWQILWEAFESEIEIDIDRSNLKRQTGFNPIAPIVISVPSDTLSRDNKLLLQFQSGGECDLIVKYSSKPMIERYAEKSLAKMFPLPHAS